VWGTYVSGVASLSWCAFLANILTNFVEVVWRRSGPSLSAVELPAACRPAAACRGRTAFGRRGRWIRRMAGAMTDDVRSVRPHEVHVWSLRLDLAQATRDRLEAFLSADEISRARRFLIPIGRSRYVCAHGLLRVVLSAYLGTRPAEVAIEAGPGGKPRLVGRRSPRFNLAHADALGLVAVSADREVGIDVERIRDVGDLRGLAERCFSPAERAALAAVDAPRRLRAFFAGWTRKEAFLKAVGDGLSRPLDSFEVTLKPGEPPRLLRVQGVPDAPARYALRALLPAPGYVGAVAAEGRGIAIHRWSYEMLAALLEAADGGGRPARRDADEPPGHDRATPAAGDGADAFRPFGPTVARYSDRRE
jgi:4'-phosphopantetheinyl transferase